MLDLAATVREEATRASTLSFLTESAIRSVPGFACASVSVREGDGAIVTHAPTDDLAVQIDDLQYELREGPCYDVLHGERVVSSPFLADESRWPGFAPRAARSGVGAMLSIELADRPGWRAALNLYSKQGGTLEPSAQAIAELYAAHASVTLGFAEKIEELQAGLRTRSTIGTAVGIVMAKYAISHDRAFRFLVRLSNDTNVKLHDIAADLVHDQDAQTADTQGSNGVPLP